MSQPIYHAATEAVPATPPRQRLWGVIVAIASAMVFIYGAFYFGPMHTSALWNVPLWLGIAGIALGGILMVRGCGQAPLQ